MIEDSPEGLSKTSKAVAILKKVRLLLHNVLPALRFAPLPLDLTGMHGILLFACERGISEIGLKKASIKLSESTAYTHATAAKFVVVWPHRELSYAACLNKKGDVSPGGRV